MVFLLRLFLVSFISTILDNRGKGGLEGAILDTNLLQAASLRSRKEVKHDIDRACSSDARGAMIPSARFWMLPKTLDKYWGRLANTTQAYSRTDRIGEQ